MEDNLANVLQFIKDYSTENGFPPAVREIGAALGINSTATVHYYLNKLQGRGEITKSFQKNRALGITKSRKIKDVPLVGLVHAGGLSIAEEVVDDNFTFSEGMFRGDELFMLQIKGDSMKNAGIADGDLAVITRQNAARHGEIVVARYENDATVKRLILRPDGVAVLHPENPDYEDIIVPDLEIVGVLTGLIRRY
jgi:repressor LexA